MKIYTSLGRIHAALRRNIWMTYFSIFCRIALAAGFIPSGLVKIFGERFTSLADTQPMGNYLEALYHTGYYYTFIGIVQVTAAVLLLIPRTATLGALLYFPIILNICLLSLAVRFEGSYITSPLMVLANLFLILWDYHKIRYILPFNEPPEHALLTDKSQRIRAFPLRFFLFAAATLTITLLVLLNMYAIEPRNSLTDCKRQTQNSQNPKAADDFCECIHTQGKHLDECLEEYKAAEKAK